MILNKSIKGFLLSFIIIGSFFFVNTPLKSQEALAAPRLFEDITPRKSHDTLQEQADNAIQAENGLSKVIRVMRNAWLILRSLAYASAFLILLYGGLLYITSAGNENRADKGKKYLTYVFIGLTIMILAEVIVNFLVNKILEGGY